MLTLHVVDITLRCLGLVVDHGELEEYDQHEDWSEHTGYIIKLNNFEIALDVEKRLEIRSFAWVLIFAE